MKRLSIVLAVALSACVSSGKHEALQKQFADAKSAHQTKEADLESALAREKAEVQALAEKVKKLESELSALQKANDALEGEKAAIVQDKAQLKSAVDEMQRALSELKRRQSEAEARLAEYRDLLGRFKALIDAGKLKVKMADGRMVVELASDVLFGSGSATLSRDGKAAIREVAGVLAGIPDRKFQIEGHTDNVPINSAVFPSNWELASARAITVVKAMVDEKMPPERISAASYGDTQPAQPNTAPEGRSANRRIQIVLVPDLSSLPGFDELNRAAK